MKKVFDGIEKVLRVAACILFAAFHIMVFIQVFTRYVLNNSLTWTEQAARYMFTWMIMLFVPVVTRGMDNLSFDVLLGKLPAKVKDITLTISDALIGLFAVYWCYWSYQLCVLSKGRMFQGLHIYKNWVYAAQPVGAFFLFLFSAEIVVNRIIDFKKKYGKKASAEIAENNDKEVTE